MNCCRKNVEAFVNLHTYCDHYGQILLCERQKETTTAGLEPARAKPKRFLIFLLNHSDKLPCYDDFLFGRLALCGQIDFCFASECLCLKCLMLLNNCRAFRRFSCV